MSHPMPRKGDADLPPPSYEESLTTPPVMPGRPQGPPQPQPYAPPGPPDQPAKPGLGPPVPDRPSNYVDPVQENDPGTCLLYTNNINLPFEYPKGHYCRKCKNTGFKEKGGKPCSQCWPKFFKNQSYNPNPGLNFSYPRGFLCARCRNTGIKLKNGLSCQDCYARFAPRNNVAQAPITYAQAPPSSFQFSPFNGFSGSGLGPGPGPAGYGPPGPPGAPQYLLPGDPRMGGILCGRCRGSGRTTFFLDQELCLICGGVGRLFN